MHLQAPHVGVCLHASMCMCESVHVCMRVCVCVCQGARQGEKKAKMKVRGKVTSSSHTS